MTDTMLSQERKYIPAIGDRIRLKTFQDYSEINLHAWEVLNTVGVDGDKVACIRPMTANGEYDAEIVTVGLDKVESPIGWQPRYTIHCPPDKVAEVLTWFQRGIVVRQSQYIGDGSTAFQPMDNASAPHWRFPSITDSIPAEECSKVFRVVKLETLYDAGIPSPCQHCNGTGKHVSNPSLEEQTASDRTCSHCGLHLGFSFKVDWHHEPNHYSHSNSQCSYSRHAGEDWVCGGTGKGMRHLSSMDRKERQAAIRQLEGDGWKVWYQRRGQVWRMDRETVVRDWDQAMAGGEGEVNS